MGGVYKLSAVRTPGESWQYKIKVSEEAIKVSDPGILQVRRYHTDSEFLGDAIYDEETGLVRGCTVVDPEDTTKRMTIPDDTPFINLLVPVFRAGQAVYETPPLLQVRQHAQDQLAYLPAGVKRFDNPQPYPVGLEQHLYELKAQLISQARSVTNERNTHGTARPPL